MSKEELYNQPSHIPNFSVRLADFGKEGSPKFLISFLGESLVYSSKGSESSYTTDNRGTEFIKSPEMLKVAYAKQVTHDAFDRRRHAGAGTCYPTKTRGKF